MVTLRKLYGLLVTAANSVQPYFLLFVRLYWGYQFAIDGWGKLTHLARVAEYFGSLGLPAPGPTAMFVSILELVGGILLAIGLGTRLIALLLFCNMTVAYYTGDHDAFLGFFAHPDAFVSASPFSYWMASLIILVYGPGYLSLDALIERMWLSKASNSGAANSGRSGGSIQAVGPQT